MLCHNTAVVVLRVAYNNLLLLREVKYVCPVFLCRRQQGGPYGASTGFGGALGPGGFFFPGGRRLLESRA